LPVVEEVPVVGWVEMVVQPVVQLECLEAMGRVWVVLVVLRLQVVLAVFHLEQQLPMVLLELLDRVVLGVPRQPQVQLLPAVAAVAADTSVVAVEVPIPIQLGSMVAVAAVVRVM
jgi:hypothetical protein